MDHEKIETILVPVDFGANAARVAGHGIDFARQTGAKIYLLYVAESLERFVGFPVPHVSFGELQKDVTAAAVRKMEEFAETHVPREVLLGSRVVSGEPAEEIVRVARELAVDMICIGTHGYQGLERTIFGSVAEQVVKTAPCPVMTVRP